MNHFLALCKKITPATILIWGIIISGSIFIGSRLTVNNERGSFEDPYDYYGVTEDFYGDGYNDYYYDDSYSYDNYYNDSYYDNEGCNDFITYNNGANSSYCNEGDIIYFDSYPERFVTLDADHFKVLNEGEGVIATDRDSIYVYGHKIPTNNKDSVVFQYMSQNSNSVYIKDYQHVYRVGLYGNNDDDGEVAIVPKVDVASFVALGAGHFKDKNGVYVEDYDELLTIQRDPYSFSVIDKMGTYTKDANGVYYNGKKIEFADPQTFVTITAGISMDGWYGGDIYYAKDSRNVYYQGKLLPEADPQQFVPIVTGGSFHEYARDAKHVYFGDKVIQGADPKTFVPLKSNQSYEGCSTATYAMDKNGVFYEDMYLPSADSATFEALIDGYGKDALHVFWKGELQSQLDVKVFDRTCEYTG